MPTQSYDSDYDECDVDILHHDGVIVARGFIRYQDTARVFVEIANFPLGTDTFLELSIHGRNSDTVRTHVRVLANTGEGLEVVLED